jgi:hypothetical protein
MHQDLVEEMLNRYCMMYPEFLKFYKDLSDLIERIGKDIVILQLMMAFELPGRCMEKPIQKTQVYLDGSCKLLSDANDFVGKIPAAIELHDLIESLVYFTKFEVSWVVKLEIKNFLSLTQKLQEEICALEENTKHLDFLMSGKKCPSKKCAMCSCHVPFKSPW